MRAWPPALWRAAALVKTWRHLEVTGSQPAWGELARELDSLIAHAFAAPLNSDALRVAMYELGQRWLARANALPLHASASERHAQAIVMTAYSRTLGMFD